MRLPLISASLLGLSAVSLIGISCLAFGPALLPAVPMVKTPVVPQVVRIDKSQIKSAQPQLAVSAPQRNLNSIYNYFAQAISAALEPIESYQSNSTRKELIHNGWLLSDAGDQQGAFRDFDKARRLDQSDALAWQGISSTYLRSGNAKGALRFLNITIALDPSDSWSWNNRACAYRALGLFHKALADENKATELDPNCGHHHFKRGLILQALGKTPEALQEFNKARQLGFDVDGQLANNHI